MKILAPFSFGFWFGYSFGYSCSAITKATKTGATRHSRRGTWQPGELQTGIKFRASLGSSVPRLALMRWEPTRQGPEQVASTVEALD